MSEERWRKGECSMRRTPAKQAAPLDKYYVPTRYPNGLPGGLPSHAFILKDAEMAIAMATAVLDFVGKRLA